MMATAVLVRERTCTFIVYCIFDAYLTFDACALRQKSVHLLGYILNSPVGTCVSYKYNVREVSKVQRCTYSTVLITKIAHCTRTLTYT